MVGEASGIAFGFVLDKCGFDPGGGHVRQETAKPGGLAAGIAQGGIIVAPGADRLAGIDPGFSQVLRQVEGLSREIAGGQTR